MEPVTNRNGDVLLGFIHMANEKAVEPGIYSPVVASSVVGGYEGKVLLVFNRKRQCWEFPSGGIEQGESLKECASRELYEESGQSVNTLDFNGLSKIRMSNGKIVFLAVFSACLQEISAFQANEEIEKNIFWDFSSDIGYINEIDLYLIKLVFKH